VLRWHIHDHGVRVAPVRLAGEGPAVLLASHLAAHHTILIYREKGTAFSGASWHG
jgi:hypothetical protein